MNDPGRHVDRSDEIAAYALGALEQAEAEALQSHLEECASCRDEHQRLRVAAEVLPLAVAQYEAPQVVGDRLMAIVRSEAQLLRAAEGTSEAAVSERRRRRVPRWLGGGPAYTFAAVVAAAVVVGVLGLAGVFSGSTGPRTLTGQVVGVPGASAVLRVNGGRGELVVSHMVQPPPGRIYEMWLQRAGRPPQPTSVLFGVTRTGTAQVAVPGALRGIQHVLVTAEPVGGSTVPTREPVIVVTAS